MHDKLLDPYLEAKSEREAERYLSRLTDDFLRPMANAVVNSILNKSHEGVKQDAIQNALVAVTRHIQQMREAQQQPANSSAEPLRSLRAYTVTVARREAIKLSNSHIQDAKVMSIEVLQETHGDELKADNADLFLQAASQESLRVIWHEIKQLSRNQCAVLLLDLKQITEGPVHIFMGAGIASAEEIATLLQVDVAILTGPLCWEDKQIATKLNTTEATVRNLRNKARYILQRRFMASSSDGFAFLSPIVDRE